MDADSVFDELAQAALEYGFYEEGIFGGATSPGWYVLRLEHYGSYVEGGVNPQVLERAPFDAAAAFIEKLKTKLRVPV